MSEHLDEGTIHAWLDGQLKPDESARIQSHIAACATCAAMVAEARGFIAASSRIVSALDGVPAKVVPARRRGPNIWQLRVAAAVVVMALGSAVFLRERIAMKGPAQYGARATDAAAARATPAPPGTADAMPSKVDSVAETSAMQAQTKAKTPTVLDQPAAPPAAAVGGQSAELKHSERRLAAAPEPGLAKSPSARNDVAANKVASRDELNLEMQKSALAERASDKASAPPPPAYKSVSPQSAPTAGAPVPPVPPKPTVIELTAQAVGVPSVCAGSVITVATGGGDSVIVRLGETPASGGGAAGQAQPSSSSGVARYAGSWAPAGAGADSAVLSLTGPGGPVVRRVSCLAR